ncbi:MAG TPA: GntR family transcriptional regulator [Candidatus Baltobacteraceae bacterium]|nr:GntR family transcriptional regulator [Candidatus Baltobacteraceae bacterium]
MPAYFVVDPHGGVPIYVQLTEQVKRAIAVGALTAGERLPTVKALAHELKLNPNTVARVYRDLEREGFIATAAGRGSFVRRNGVVDEARRAASTVASTQIDAAVREARSLGLTRTEVRDLADGAIARWYPEADEEQPS